tara:strand:+ start:2816 stop:2995 length:180 start_codon:yes stop_codon:yes gene_type:complete
MTHVDLVYASDCEEFFYNDGDIPVSEGQLIGVDVYLEDRVDLILLDDIYWKPNHEEETE